MGHQFSSKIFIESKMRRKSVLSEHQELPHAQRIIRLAEVGFPFEDRATCKCVYLLRKHNIIQPFSKGCGFVCRCWKVSSLEIKILFSLKHKLLAQPEYKSRRNLLLLIISTK
jgi:hypothetical protein